MAKRVENLNEIGRVLLEKYNGKYYKYYNSDVINLLISFLIFAIILIILGTFTECVKACNNSAEKLLKLIVTDFPCFRDEAVYKNQRGIFQLNNV